MHPSGADVFREQIRQWFGLVDPEDVRQKEDP
jgi:hypothetical protein